MKASSNPSTDVGLQRVETLAPATLTEVLRGWQGSDPESLAAVLPHLCRDLQVMARSQMAREAPGHTLQPTALVNEFFLRLAAREGFRWRNRRQFFGFAAETMRRILVDHARRRHRAKRGGGLRPLSLQGDGCPWEEMPLPGDGRPAGGLSHDLEALGDALQRLEALDARKARIIDLRFFVGLTVAETAAVLGLSEPTVKRDWRAAKLWLLRELRGR